MKTSSLLWSGCLMAAAILGFGYIESRGRDLGDLYELPKPIPDPVANRDPACLACGSIEGLESRLDALEARVSALESVRAVRRSTGPVAAPEVVQSPVMDVRPGHWTIREVPASRASMSQIVSHLAEHGVSASGSREELLSLHDSLHEGGMASAAAPVTVVRSTPAVVRSTYRSAPVRTRRLFGSRARTCPAGGCP